MKNCNKQNEKIELVDEKTFVVVDKTLYELYKQELFINLPAKQLYVLNATEENKVLDTAMEICEIMTSIPAKRNSRLVSISGRDHSGIAIDGTKVARQSCKKT